MAGRPRRPSATAPVSVASATSDHRIRPVCVNRRVRLPAGNGVLSRQASASSQPTTARPPLTEAWLSPTSSSAHSPKRAGLCGSLDSPKASSTSSASTLQNSTAGPMRGPPSSQIQRSGLISTCTVALTLGWPRRMSGTGKTVRMPSWPAQSSRAVCRPGCTGRRTVRPSWRIGWARPSIATACSCAPGGRVTGSWPPCELWKFRLSEACVARLPGRSRSSLPSMVRVSPGAPAGWVMASVTCSPGQGRHSGCQWPSGARWWTTAMPELATCQRGPMARRQTSDQRPVSGAASVRVACRASDEVQPPSVSPAGRLKRTWPPAAGRSAVSTDSPGNRGISSVTALSGGVRRRTRVTTRQSSPSARVRSTSRKAGSGSPAASAGREDGVSPVIRSRRSCTSGTPCSPTPSIRQPLPAVSIRCGRRGRGSTT